MVSSQVVSSEPVWPEVWLEVLSFEEVWSFWAWSSAIGLSGWGLPVIALLLRSQLLLERDGNELSSGTASQNL